MCQQKKTRDNRELVFTTTHRSTDRATVSPRLILGSFVFFVVIGPLIAVFTRVQSAFASVPEISPAYATLLAVLIVGAIVAAAMEK